MYINIIILICISLIANDIEHLFISHLYALFGEICTLGFGTFSNLIVHVITIEFEFFILDRFFVGYVICKYFSHTVTFHPLHVNVHKVIVLILMKSVYQFFPFMVFYSIKSKNC